MIYVIYAIYDKKDKIIQNPFIATCTEEAERQKEKYVSTIERVTDLQQNKDDYRVIELGLFENIAIENVDKDKNLISVENPIVLKNEVAIATDTQSDGQILKDAREINEQRARRNLGYERGI